MRRTLLIAVLALAGLLLGSIPAVAQDCTKRPNVDEQIECLNDKIDKAKKAELPAAMIAFFVLDKCPNGWRDAVGVRGRYVVGVTEGGTLGDTVGQKLADRENRPAGRHVHPYVDKYNEAPGGEGKIYDGGSWSPQPHKLKTDPAEGQPNSVVGTNAPYIQLLACEKS